MGYVRGERRQQVYLLPEAIDDYVAAENPVRFLDVFVEKLDLAELRLRGPRRRRQGDRPTTPGTCCGCTCMAI